MIRRHSKAGFTLIEVVVVVAILAILAGAMVPRVTHRMAAARDARRLSDVSTVRAAVEQYYVDKGHYPAPQPNNAHGGWDVSLDGDLIPLLVGEGYLPSAPADPVNDETYHYRYYVYEEGAFGCKGVTEFYVLGIRNFETADYARRHRGFFRCNQRNWGEEFAYVTGGGATWKD